MVPGLQYLWFGIRNEKYFRCFDYDIERYRKHSAHPDLDRTRSHLKARIVMDYHRLEKGLALRSPRPGFGIAAATQLIANLHKYIELYGADDNVIISLSVLVEYCAYNSAQGADLKSIRESVDALEQAVNTRAGGCEGGTLLINREELFTRSKRDLSDFFASRHSVRNFSAEDVDIALLDQAIRMASRTPSVCNRQSPRVHVVTTSSLIQEALTWQNGNRGFAELVNKVLIVTADLECFVHPAERYQVWIDGGMFAMSLVYALHSLGLGCCCLNWDVNPSTDRGMRKALEIPDNESIIMLIAVGHLPEQFSVAASTRKSLDALRVIH